MTREIIWLDLGVILSVHDQQLAEHGGSSGLRDRGLMESAMARAENRLAYGQPDLADMAAAYGFGIVRNHPFVDGNERTAFVAIELFLCLNGSVLTASDAASVTQMLGLAAGDVGDAELAAWIRENSLPP